MLGTSVFFAHLSPPPVPEAPQSPKPRKPEAPDSNDCCELAQFNLLAEKLGGAAIAMGPFIDAPSEEEEVALLICSSSSSSITDMCEVYRSGLGDDDPPKKPKPPLLPVLELGEKRPPSCWSPLPRPRPFLAVEVEDFGEDGVEEESPSTLRGLLLLDLKAVRLFTFPIARSAAFGGLLALSGIFKESSWVRESQGDRSSSASAMKPGSRCSTS
mmetsp:Transcript_40726/g.75733  ORF Transcript_40726/g.75733 Transcript_40726/m.75733 type:complete len:214 (-) Transcript_40726:255-896(-)